MEEDVIAFIPTKRLKHHITRRRLAAMGPKLFLTLICVVANSYVEGKDINMPAIPAVTPLPVLTRNDKPQVDYAALCARNDLVYLQPAVWPFEAMHLGNGNLGVCLWNAGGMTWQFNNGSYRLGTEAVSSGRATFTTPVLNQTKPDKFEQRVNLWDGTVTTQIEGPGGSGTGESFVAEGEDVFVFHCRESGASAGPRELTLHLWPSRGAAHFVTGPDFVAITEHSDHAEEYLATNMALLLKVDGAQVKAGQRDARILTLTFVDKPAEYTIYIANPLAKGTKEDALSAAQAAIARVQAKGYKKLLAERKAFWHGFWTKSFLHITDPTGEGDFLENLRYLFFWDLASMSRNTLCPKFNGGNWLVEKDSRYWGGNYWHQNTRELFWPVYAANHVELSDPFFELYWRMTGGARERGRQSFGADGFHFGECVPLPLKDGITSNTPVVYGALPRPKQTPGSWFTHLLTVALEVSLQAWWRYEYTGDETFLRERAYPLLKGSLDFYLNYAQKGADGKYHFEPANAQETYWAVKDPHQDLAALRWGLPVARAISEKLNVDADLRPRWQDLLDNLAPFPVDTAKNVFLPAILKPTDEKKNGENIEDYGIYPFGVFGLGLPDYERAKNTFLNRPFPQVGSWEPAAICAARLGLADEAAKLELEHLVSSMRFNNGGWYSVTTLMFAGLMPDCPYYDSPGVSAQALNEMALQSHNGIIRLAPAWPERWQLQFRLRARGGFMVTAETDKGAVRYALIESEWGRPCKLANPWKETAVVTCDGKEILRSDKPELAFTTQKGKVYRIERASQPLTKMEFAPLKPKPNTGPKFIGRHLPAYPIWNHIASLGLAYLGIDAQGQTPQRAKMRRDVESQIKHVAAVTTNLDDLSTGKAQVKVTFTKGEPRDASALVDGAVGPAGWVEVLNQEAVIVDLGSECTVQALLFSRDRTGLYVDGPASGYVWECSLNGTNWTILVNAEKRGAAAIGQLDSIPPTKARYFRLKVTGPWERPVFLDEVTIFGSRSVTH